ncbi:MAG: ribonuclease HII [Candidatus Omnitrophica bacterium]|nr:ribonuclease HII [Candidatus Omnitrophota bacterium]
MLSWERKAFLKGFSIIIGVDEAGRGPLAGPVVAGAVILNRSPLRIFKVPEYKENIDDSKKLRPPEREKAFKEISAKAIFGVGIKDNKYIDRENIHMATLAAMKQAVKKLVFKFCRLANKKEKDVRKDICVLVDGLFGGFLPYKTIPIIKGDSKSFSIAAASIVAKVMRDAIMDRYDKKYPLYGFFKHKGYGTRFHLEAIKQHGPCLIHRKSFAPISEDIACGIRRTT